MAKIGVIDVGGGLRGIYAAGVFDWCLETALSLTMVSAFRQVVQTWLPI